MPVDTYNSRIAEHTRQFERLNKKLRWLSFTRLVLFVLAVVCCYNYFSGKGFYWILGGLSSLAVFLYCIRLYDVIKSKADFFQALITVNKNEVSFLEGIAYPYSSGKEYIDPHHAYSYDLDVFGDGSLFSYLNRTTTRFGHEQLAQALLTPDISAIKERQESIRELSERMDFRQNIQAAGKLHSTDPKDLDKLFDWIRSGPAFSNPAVYFALLIFPVATLVTLAFYFSYGTDRWLNVFTASFVLNLIITSFFIRNMLKQVSVSTTVTKVLQQFSLQLNEILSENFQSPGLKKLQQQLQQDGTTASHSIGKLASLFGYLDFIMNLVVSSLLNGMFLFHLHILFALDKWKKEKKGSVANWLAIIGAFESLNSFSNFSFNNKKYCYPNIVSSESLSGKSMRHPLIRQGKSVGNDLSMPGNEFIILTGSNMSGKSTFLRTVGINIVLARAGSVVCADSFSFFPFELHASMRITDSLQDNESFFYAELKRLKEIITELEEGKKLFVILDEILRGTNSNDKHSGTVGLIRKMAALNASGILATHDLTVAGLSTTYPGYMENKCFESEIINGELVFDYKLKEGVCTKLNASFLMKKMGVID